MYISWPLLIIRLPVFMLHINRLIAFVFCLEKFSGVLTAAYYSFGHSSRVKIFMGLST